MFESTPALYRFQFRLFHRKLNFVGSRPFSSSRNPLPPIQNENSNPSGVPGFNSCQSLSEVVVGILWKGDFFFFFVPVSSRLERVVESCCGYFVLVGQFRLWELSYNLHSKERKSFLFSRPCVVSYIPLSLFFYLARFLRSSDGEPEYRK